MYTIREIATMYGLHPETMSLKLQRLGIRPFIAGHGNRPRITPVELELLKTKIGQPRFAH